MATVTITEIVDDLRAADEITHRYERRYWLASADFYELYSQGLLDDGEHTEDFALRRNTTANLEKNEFIPFPIRCCVRQSRAPSFQRSRYSKKSCPPSS